MAARDNFLKSLDVLMGSGIVAPSSPTTQAYNKFKTPTPIAPLSSSQGLGDMRGSTPSNSGNNDPWWMDILHGASSVGTAVTDQLANWTDGKATANDIPLWGSLKNAGRGQLDAWKDGSVGFSDIPGMGALIGVGKYGKHSEDVIDNLGWKESEADPNAGYNFLKARKGQFDIHDLVSLAGDIGLDPLTYLTFGAGSALKAGKAASTGAARDIAKEAGMNVSRKAAVKNVPDMVANAYKERWLNQPDIDRYMVEDVAKKIKSDTANKITDAGKSAREKAQNAAFSFDVPFADLTKQFGSKADFLKIRDAKIGANGMDAVATALEKAGLDINSPQAQALLKATYGVDNVEDITLQGLKHLQEQADLFGKARGTAEFNPNVRMEQFATELNRTFDLEGILNSLRGAGTNKAAKILEDAGLTGAEPSRLAREAPDLLRSGANQMHDLSNSWQRPSITGAQDTLNNLADILKGAENSASIKYNPESLYKMFETTPAADTVDNFMASMNKFVQDSGGKSALGGKMPSWFNPRSFGSKDAMVNQGAEYLRDAETQSMGQAAQLGNVMKGFAKDVEGMSEADKKHLIYLMEGKTPAGMDLEDIVNSPNGAKLQEVASKMQEFLKGVGAADLKAGTVPSLRDNYFPHVIKPDAERMARLQEAFKDDPSMLSKFAGRSAANGFGKERASFDSFAEWDDAVAKLDKGITDATNAGDADLAEKLMQAKDDLSQIFERDPVKALAERGLKSVKTKAMAELHSKLKDDGLLKIHTASNSAGKLRPDSNTFKTLSAAEAKSLGIKAPDGSAVYMHNEVYEGLQKMHTMLTDKGAQKVLDMMTDVVSIWKNLVTTLVPAHYVNNFIGNVANNAMAGVKIKHYAEAGSLLKKYKNAPETMNADEKQLIQELFDKGAMGGHGQNSEWVKPSIDFKRDTKLAKAADFVAHNKVSAAMREKFTLGNPADDFTRAALYIHGKELTGSADKAAGMVRKYLFNYNELTNADKWVRAFAPFWNWTKHNLPLQLHGLFTQPRFAGTYLKVKDALQGEEAGNTPDWINEGYLKIPGTDKTYWNPRLPLSDLNQVGGPSKDLQSTLSMLNPALKIPIELGANHQFFSDKPIDYDKQKEGSYDPATVGKYLMSQSGILGKAANVVANPDDPINYLNFILGKPVTLK